MAESQSLEQLLASVFGVDVSEINDQTSPNNLSSWDSFNGLKLIEVLESQYRLQLDVDELVQIKRVADIKKILRKHEAM